MKKLVSYKLSDVVLGELEGEAKRTGKTRTAVVEDALTFQRQFNDEAESAIEFLANKHGLPRKKVVEFCVLKAAGLSRNLPFSRLAAA